MMKIGKVNGAIDVYKAGAPALTDKWGRCQYPIRATKLYYKVIRPAKKQWYFLL